MASTIKTWQVGLRGTGAVSGGARAHAGPVHPSFRALSGRLKFTVQRHKFNKDSLPCMSAAASPQAAVERREINLTCFDMQDMVAEGKIRHLALTNFDTENLAKIKDAGINIVSNQVKGDSNSHGARPVHLIITMI